MLSSNLLVPLFLRLHPRLYKVFPCFFQDRIRCVNDVIPNQNSRNKLKGLPLQLMISCKLCNVHTNLDSPLFIETRFLSTFTHVYGIFQAAWNSYFSHCFPDFSNTITSTILEFRIVSAYNVTSFVFSNPFCYSICPCPYRTFSITYASDKPGSTIFNPPHTFYCNFISSRYKPYFCKSSYLGCPLLSVSTGILSIFFIFSLTK